MKPSKFDAVEHAYECQEEGARASSSACGCQPNVSGRAILGAI